MSKFKRIKSQQEFELFISKFLRNGVIIAISLVFSGGVLYLMRHEKKLLIINVSARTRAIPQSFMDFNIYFIWSSSWYYSARFITTYCHAYIKSYFSLLAFFRQRDRTYIIITLIVISGLIYSLIKGYFKSFFHMELLNKSQYALLALLELSKIYDTGESLQIKQIAVSQDIPVRYLEELMGTLRKGGLIKSIRGARGGYVLAREPKKITVLDAYKCIQGLDKVLSAGNITNKTLEVEIINSYWQEATTAAESVFQEKTLFDLCERLAKVQHMELMYYI